MTTHMPALVLMPGMDGTGDLFAPLLAALDARVETIVVRYPSDRLLDYAGLIPIARAALPAGRPFVIVAESFSGPIGISLAAERPRGLRGLALCGTFARNPRPMLAGIARWSQSIPMNDVLPRIALPAMLGTGAGPSLRAQVEQTVRSIPHEVLRARLDAVLRVDVSRELAMLDAPILYLQASRDRAVPKSAANLIRRIRPDTKLVRVDAPHFLLQVAANAAAVELERFAASVSAEH